MYTLLQLSKIIYLRFQQVRRGTEEERREGRKEITKTEGITGKTGGQEGRRGAKTGSKETRGGLIHVT